MLVTINGTVVSNWVGPSAVQLWITADEPFMASDGTMIQSGSGQTVVRKITCTVDTSAKTLTIPSIANLYSTTDSLDRPTACYSFSFHRTNGGKIRGFESFDSVKVPAIALQDWEDLRVYNIPARHFVRDNTGWTRDESDARYALLGSTINSVGTIDSQSKSANALNISGGGVIAQTADLTSPGVVSITTQSFAGNKTFTGVSKLGAGTTEADGVWANLGASTTALKVVDSTSAAANTTATPLMVGQTWRTVNQTLLPYLFATYRIGINYGDMYGLYGVAKDLGDYTGAPVPVGSAYNSSAVRGRTEMRQTNIPTGGSAVNFASYAGLFEAARYNNVPTQTRIVSVYAQVENQTTTDADTSPALGYNSVVGVVSHAGGLAACTAAYITESTDINTAFAVMLQPGVNSIKLFGTDYFPMTYQIRGTWTSNGTTTITGTSGKATMDVVVGDLLLFNGTFYQVASIGGINSITLTATVGAAAGQTITKRVVPFRLANCSPIQVVANDDTNTYNLLYLDRSNDVRMFTPGTVKFGSTDGTITYGQFANQGGSGQTGLRLLVNDGAVTSVRQVVVGAVDSGGTGFRVLSVAN